MIRTYPTPEAFKQALEQRLRTSANGGVDFARRRQLLVFDRFLARIAAVLDDSVTLKGGLVLELRLDRARTTNDIDLRMQGSPDHLLERLQEAARHHFSDFFTYEVRPDDHHPEIQGDGIQYDGYRFRVECRLAGKIYGRPFGLDVAFGDPIFGEPDRIVTDDMLAFAGVAPASVRLYPVETHVAEKLHAYTMPRSRPNSRIKDLPDIALLATTRALDAMRLRAALAQTFGFRRTHELPTALPEPSASWMKPYEAMAREDALPWSTLDDVMRAARSFVNPLLVSELEATWDPTTWTWRVV